MQRKGLVLVASFFLEARYHFFLFPGPSQSIELASTVGQVTDPDVQHRGESGAAGGFGMGGGGARQPGNQQQIRSLEQQLQREKEMFTQQQKGSKVQY